MDIHVPRPKFEEMEDKISCCTIAEKGRSKGTVYINNEMFVITGGIGDGKGIGFKSLFAMKAVLLKDYSGALKPLKYNDHSIDRLEGNREVGYNGLLIESDRQSVVLIGETIYIRPTENEIQFELKLNQEGVTP